MSKIPAHLSLCLLALCARCGGSGRPRVASVHGAGPPITRTLLAHHDLPVSPGWETRLYRIEYGPGVAAPVHHHPAEGMGYVVSGSFESAFEGEAPAIVREGQSFTDRALTPHTLFRNADAARPLVFLITYVVRHDEPVVETP